MDIIVPDTDLTEVCVLVRTPFMAVARDEKGNDVSDLATFSWTFPDAKEPNVGNPVTYRFPEVGRYVVSVAASLEADSGCDETTIIAIRLDGGLRVDPPDEEDFTFTARYGQHIFGATVCDDVALVVHCDALPLGWDWYSSTFERKVDGVWTEVETTGIYYDYPGWSASTAWFTEQEAKNIAVEWRVKSCLEEVGSDPPVGADPVLYETWTPDNTVVKATGDPIILHHADDTSHTIGWDIDHHAALDPNFIVTVTIYDLSGNTVTTLTDNDAAVGAGSVIWNTNLPEENGIYTYKIQARHYDDWDYPVYMCADQDKSQGLAISNLSATSFQWVEKPTKAQVTFSYQLSRGAAACDLDIYNHDLGEVTVVEPTGGGQLESTAGAHQCTVVFEDPDQIVGVFSFVVSALESTSDGAANRDGLQKLARQMGYGIAQWPSAWNVPGKDEPDPAREDAFDDAVDKAVSSQARGDDHTWYLPTVGAATGVACFEAIDDCAIFNYVGHGAPNHCALQLYSTSHQLRGGTEGETPSQNDANADIYYISEESAGALDLCRFAFFVGCRTGLANASGASLLDAARSRGADCAAGFKETMYLWALTDGVPAFWEYAMIEGCTVDAAAIQVLMDLEAANQGDDGGWGAYLSLGNVSLIPARWGE